MMPTAPTPPAPPITVIRPVGVLTVLALSLSAGPARAHFMLLYPPARGVSLESTPCGPAGSARGATPTVLRPGQTIVVRWNVQVDHLEPPKFRIAFDDAGQDFPTPVGAHDTSTLPLFLDGVLAPGGGVQTKEIALPDLECDNCTLQMLQYLNPAPPYAAGNFYYQCADITLSAGAPGPVDAASDGLDASEPGDAPMDAAMPAPVDAATIDGPPPPDAPDSPSVRDAATEMSLGAPPDSAPPAAVTGSSGCQVPGDAPVAPLAPLAALVAWVAAVRRSSP